MKQTLFRAWDTEKQRMFHAMDKDIFCFYGDGRWSFSSGHSEGLTDRSGVLMQATGLKDRDSKDIYFEDIVTDDSFRLYVVDWYDNGWSLREMNGSYSGHRHFKDVTYMAVIGNTFENPELVNT